MKKLIWIHLFFIVLAVAGATGTQASTALCPPMQMAALHAQDCCGSCDCSLTNGERAADWAGSAPLSLPKPEHFLSTLPARTAHFGASDVALPGPGHSPPRSGSTSLYESFRELRI